MNNSKKEWQDTALAKALGSFPGRRERFENSSGIDIDPLYTPEDLSDFDYQSSLGYPGEYPFTRGIQPAMYRSRLWTMRQYAG
ncbi:MAG: methylmalonyl-CoA mutase family protein, partial [Dehalococcoidia bacterium]